MNSLAAIFWVLAYFLPHTNCFPLKTISRLKIIRSQHTVLYISDKSSSKGFGRKQVTKSDQTKIVTDGYQSNTKEEVSKLEIINSMDTSNLSLTDEELILNSKMFQNKKVIKKDNLKDKIQKLKEEEDLLASDPSVGAVPEIVADRMIERIAIFFGNINNVYDYDKIVLFSK